MISPKEQELTEKLFPESNKKAKQPYIIKFNTRALLQGDLKAQQEFFHSMINDAVLSPNDVLEMMDMPEYEGGDEHYIQSATVPISILKEVLLSKKANSKPVTKEKYDKLKQLLNGKTDEAMNILNG